MVERAGCWGSRKMRVLRLLFPSPGNEDAPLHLKDTISSLSKTGQTKKNPQDFGESYRSLFFHGF